MSEITFTRLDARARAGLTVDDQVVTDAVDGGHRQLATVVASTDTQLTLSDGERYSKRTGIRIRRRGLFSRRAILGRATTTEEHE